MVNPLSLASFQIFPYFKENKLGTATAFFYTSDDEVFLVTNWHNVTGRRPSDCRLISRPCIPDSLVVRPHLVVPGAGFRTEILYANPDLVVPLYEDERMFEPRWYEHPIHGRGVDVVVIPWRREVNPDGLLPLTFYLTRNLFEEVGCDVFILGYPLGISCGDLPIWKRGSVATEPSLDIDEMPKLYIDSATREGMSGSPVFIKNINYVSAPGEIVPGKPNLSLLGVYSGRQGAVDVGAQLGIVWKAKVIREIIEARSKGVSSFMLNEV